MMRNRRRLLPAAMGMSPASPGCDAFYTELASDDWHSRLLNGSDYPLPGIVPLYSMSRLEVADGMLLS